MPIEVLAIGSDNLVRLDGLTNASSAAYVNNATVTYTLKDANGNALISNSSMPYVSGTNGRYEGTVPYTQALTKDATYTLEITATGGGYTIFRKLSCTAKYRSSQ